MELLLTGVQELSQKNEELETKLADGEAQEEELQDEVDELNLQLQVMEASKNDIARMYNNQGVEMQNMYTVMERDRHHRQDLNAKLHHEEHVNHLRSSKIDELNREVVRLNDLVFSHKEASHHAQDKIGHLQIELQDTKEEMKGQRDNYRHIMTDLRAKLEMSQSRAQEQEVS